VENIDVVCNNISFCVRQYIDPLPALLVKEEMTDEEVVQCKQVIYSLINLETKHEPLQMPNMGQRGKGPKRCVETGNSFVTLFLKICA
jgi:hypothetical protein